MEGKNVFGDQVGNGRFHQAILAAILLLYLLLTLGYSVLNPLFEAPDEHFHFFTLNDLANSGKLPVIPEEYDELLGSEPAQPPLYYLISALVITPLDTAAAREQVQLNPFAWIGSTEAVVNINRTLITPWEQRPWQGYALAGHLVRGLSALFGLGTVLAVYGSARLLWPQDGRCALLAAALVGFLPQFNFIHAAITNDSLITFLATVGIWQLLRMWQTAVTRKRLLLLGITIGLAALTKNAGILLFIFSLGVLFLRFLRDDGWQSLGRWLGETAVFVILPVLAMAGWLWLRNQMLYGDFTAANQFIDIAGGDRQSSLGQVLGESGGLWLSFIAVFGWFNLLAPSWIYAAWNGIFLLAALGFIFALFKIRVHLRSSASYLLNQPWLPGLLLFGWFAAVYTGLLTFMLQTEAAQGRLLFPAIAPIVLGVVYGISRLGSSLLYWLAGGAALLTTVFALFGVIAPTYALPQTVAALPDEAIALNETMAENVVLVGAKVETETAVPGDIVWYTLYWWLDAPTTAMPAFKFEIFGRDLERPIGEIHTFHGRGLYPPSLWPVGQIVADRFPVRLNEQMDAPVLARGFARLVPVEDEALPDANQGIFAGGIKITPQEWPAVAEQLALLGDAIALTAVSLSTNTAKPGDTILIDITWQAIGNPQQDFATLIHLAEANQPPLAQGDDQPRGGSYPTRIWAAGEVIPDQYRLIVPPDLPLGCYPVWLGMYTVADTQRLPLTVNRERLPDDVYKIDDLCVGES